MNEAKNAVEPSRRTFLTRAFGTASALLLGGCERLSHTDWFPKMLAIGETASEAVAKLVTSRKSMAQEFVPEDISPSFRSNGTSEPDSDAYRTLAANGSADYGLEVGGLVEAPMRLSLAAPECPSPNPGPVPCEDAASCPVVPIGSCGEWRCPKADGGQSYCEWHPK